MASPSEDFLDATTQGGVSNVPRIEVLAQEIAETRPPVRQSAKRKHDIIDIRDDVPDPLPTATTQENGNNSEFSSNWEPPQGIITRRDLDEIFAKLNFSTKRLNEARGGEVREEGDAARQSRNPS